MTQTDHETGESCSGIMSTIHVQGLEAERENGHERGQKKQQMNH